MGRTVIDPKHLLKTGLRKEASGPDRLADRSPDPPGPLRPDRPSRTPGPQAPNY